MRFHIHPERPNPRLIGQVADLMRDGGVIAYPTDTVYGLGCDMFNKKGVERIYSIKGKSTRAPLAILCSDLKDIATYARVGDVAYRLMKRLLPGPYTLVFRATKLVPRVMLSAQKTIGIRIPDHPIPRELVSALGNPVVTSSVPLPDGLTYNDPNEIEERLGHALAGVVGDDLIFPEPSTVIDFSDMPPRLLRRGKGELEGLGHIELVDEPTEETYD